MVPGKQYTPLDYLQMAVRRKWLILVPLVLGAYGGLVVSSRLRDLYQSEMLIQVVPQRVPDAYVRSTVTMRTEERLAALSQQVLSRTELERLITQMDLYRAERGRLPLQDVVELMRSRIAVDPVRSQTTRDSESFYVRFTYADPTVVTQVTERLGALFIDMNARDRGDLAEATNDFLQSQLAEARGRLEEQERKLEIFRQRNAGRLPQQQDFNMQVINRTQQQIQSIVESLARDRDRKLMQERLLNDALSEPEPVAVVVQPPSMPNANGTQAPQGSPEQQLAAARETLARLEFRLTPQHPDVVRTKRTIQDLERRVAEDAAQRATDAADRDKTLETAAVAAVATRDEVLRRDRLRQARAEVESLERQIAYKEGEEQRLRSLVDEYQSRIEQVPGLESEWTALTRDYDTVQNTYKTLLAKSEESQVATELEKRQIGEQFRVLDPARPPTRPTGVNRIQVNAIATAIGLAIGLLLAAVVELRDTTYQTADDIGAVLALPVLALVPFVPTAADRLRSTRRRLIVSTVAIAAVVAGGYGAWTMELWRHFR